jgi:hypothetical protein
MRDRPSASSASAIGSDRNWTPVARRDVAERAHWHRLRRVADDLRTFLQDRPLVRLRGRPAACVPAPQCPAAAASDSRRSRASTWRPARPAQHRQASPCRPSPGSR